MKKNIFILLIGTLFILILLYFYDKKELIINKEYINNNIHIEYPYFNNKTIDNYLNNYLNDKINNYSQDFIFIDYDYEILDNIINLSLYTHLEHNNKIKNITNNLIIDLDKASITTLKDKTSNNYEYYAYSDKIIDKSKPMIAITFDDGPNHNTKKVLDILERYKVKATFFTLGSNIKGNEDIIKRMNKLGMEIGNHTYNHKLLSKLSKTKIKEEIDKTDTLISNIINKKPTLLRPSYGTTNKKIKELANRPIIIWDIDTLDWKYHNSKRIANTVLKKVKDGDIILMHDIYNATANSLDIFLPKLINKGYQIVTVTELFYYKDLKLDNNKVYGFAR